jgi:hypothetical protein
MYCSPTPIRLILHRPAVAVNHRGIDHVQNVADAVITHACGEQGGDGERRAPLLVMLQLPVSMLLCGVGDLMTEDGGKLRLILDNLEYIIMDDDDSIRICRGVKAFLHDSDELERNFVGIAFRKITLICGN